MVWLLLACAVCRAEPTEDSTLTLDQALAAPHSADEAAFAQNAQRVALPDDWSVSRPHFDGSMVYRLEIARPAGTDPHEMLALYVERACSTLDVFLNGQHISSGGSQDEPVSQNCYYPQLISLPQALLQPGTNRLELHVQGHALQRMASRNRAGGLSRIQLGPQSVLAAKYDARLFWNVTAVQVVSVVLAVLGCVMIGLGWVSRRDAHLGYFGLLSVTWALLSVRSWWREMPWDTGVMEFLFLTGFAPLVALAVQFLLSYAGMRSRWIESGLVAQWV
jgi:hypothetical protein